MHNFSFHPIGGAMSAARPECAKCGGNHWRFVACDKAAEVAASEDANAVKREQLKVYPQWRKPDGRLAPTTTNWSTGFKRGN